MSFLGKVFGTDKAIQTTIGHAKELMDDAFYTDQEKAADRSAARDKAQGLIVEWIEASHGSRLARRYIALSITGIWLVIFVVGTAIDALMGWETSEVRQAAMQLSSDALSERNELMRPAVMLILGFYFAGPYMGEVAGKALQSFGRGSK